MPDTMEALRLIFVALRRVLRPARRRCSYTDCPNDGRRSMGGVTVCEDCYGLLLRQKYNGPGPDFWNTRN